MAILHTTGPLIPALSGGLVPTNLTGNFLATAGINTNYWDNQVSSGANIRRFNGVTHSTTDPDHWLFDGTNDYLGKSAGSGYGGSTPFTYNPSNAFTLAQWFKYNNANHHIFYSCDADNTPDIEFGYPIFPRLMLSVLTSNDQCRLKVVSTDDSGFPAQEESATHTFSNFTFSDDVWYYVTLTYNGSNLYKLYVNGSFVGSNAVRESDNGNQVVMIGIERDGAGASIAYTGANTKVGHVHVYTRELTNSQVRQNFLHTHDIHNTRWYGRTYES